MKLIALEQSSIEELNLELREIKEALEKMTKKDPLKEKWLTITEVCALLHVSKRTFFNYHSKGILSYSQIGSKIYVKADDIQALLEKHYNKSS